jgi:hypothetical protein
MSKRVLSLAVLTFAFLGATHAGVISLYGDIDCFGLGGSCPDGSGFTTDLGGVQFADYRSAAEIASNSVTDIWQHQNPAVAMTYDYTLDATPVSAIFTTRIAGIGNAGFGPDDVTFDGALIGEIPANRSANSDQEVLTYSFAVPTGLLTGDDTVSIAVVHGADGFSIDYGQLSVITAAAATPTPEPSTFGALCAGLAGLLARRLRKGQTRP